MTAVLRASLVDYVNAWPLTWGLLRGAVEGIEALTDIPSACADRLARGEVEAGLVPSIEAARIPGIRIVRGVGIASRERVRSVILVSRGPLEAAKTVALDVASRSSAAMARILFRDLLGMKPAFHTAAPDLDEMLAHHDAALLIGDPALKVDLTGLHVLDLAEGWRQLTGLPFVFAVWAVRPSVPPEPFLWSREYAKTHMAEVVATASQRTGLEQGALLEVPRRKPPSRPRGRGREGPRRVLPARARSRPAPLARSAALRRRSARAPPGGLTCPRLPSLRPSRRRSCRTRPCPALAARAASRRRSRAFATARGSRSTKASRALFGSDPFRGRRGGGCGAPEETPGRSRHVPDRPEHQLHQRLHLPVRVLRVLPGRATRRATCCRSRRSAGRSRRRSRSAGRGPPSGRHPRGLPFSYYEEMLSFLRDEIPADAPARVLGARKSTSSRRRRRRRSRTSSGGFSRRAACRFPAAGPRSSTTTVRKRIWALTKSPSREWARSPPRGPPARPADDRDDDVRRRERRTRAPPTSRGRPGRSRTSRSTRARDRFTAFIPWTFQEENTALDGTVETASGIDYLRTLAIARLYLDNVPHVQGSWVTQGAKIGSVATSSARTTSARS